MCAPTIGQRSARGSIIHGRARDRPHSPPRVHVPLVDLASCASQSVRGSDSVSVDDHTGLELDREATKSARELEMKTFRDMEVYDYVPKVIAKADKKGKLVGVRWVDTQNGPIVRSRLVAQEFAGETSARTYSRQRLRYSSLKQSLATLPRKEMEARVREPCR